MGKLSVMLAIYAQDLRKICGIMPDTDMLHRVTLLLGPQALNPKTAHISLSDLPKAVANFMASQNLPAAMQVDMAHAVIDTYQKPDRYRAVVAYLIAQNFALRGRLVGGQSFNL